MFSIQPAASVLWAAIFSGIVLIVFWFEYRRLRARLLKRESQMRHRMYELSILRELGERIGYSLNVRQIVEVISGSLANLLPYSAVAYMLPNEEERVDFSITLAESVNKTFIAEVKTQMLKGLSALFSRPFSVKDIDETVAGSITDPASKRKVQSAFNVPIVISNRPAGILTVVSTRPGLYKTSSEVEILYTIMNQASEAVTKLQTVLEIEKGKLNAMVASMADGVLMVGDKNQVLVVNPQARALLGLTKEEPTIFDVLDVLADRFDLRTKMQESLKKDQLLVGEEIELNNHFLKILITPVKDDKARPLGAVVLFHDMTKEKELEKMREDFTSMMVHELRSPLTGIRSIASLLKNERIKTEEQKYREFVDLIATNSNSMLDLVNDLLDVAKLESGKFQVFKRAVNLRQIVHSRAESFEGLARENKLTLEEKVEATVPETILADDAKLGQVLNNLLSNAIKFTPAGGKIAVSAFVCPKGKDLAEEAVNLNHGWPGAARGVICEDQAVVMSVADTGLGIPPAEIPKLFNKFQQISTSGKSQKKGTGLGLVVVKGIVEAHGGRVGVYSEEGKGSVFYLTLPLNERTALQSQSVTVPQTVKT